MLDFQSSNLKKLRDEVFGGQEPEWKISSGQGLQLLYAETKEIIYLVKPGTDAVYVQPKSPPDAPTMCYQCGGRVFKEKPQTGDRKEPVMYCPVCEKEPNATSVAVE